VRNSDSHTDYTNCLSPGKAIKKCSKDSILITTSVQVDKKDQNKPDTKEKENTSNFARNAPWNIETTGLF
jgi:hypothetical protein